MFYERHHYEVGDLVILLQSLEWNEMLAVDGEIGVVIKVYDSNDEETFFDLLVVLADGCHMPVWLGEVEKLPDVC